MAAECLEMLLSTAAHIVLLMHRIQAAHAIVQKKIKLAAYHSLAFLNYVHSALLTCYLCMEFLV